MGILIVTMFRQLIALVCLGGLVQASRDPIDDLLRNVCLDVVTDLDEWLTSDATEGVELDETTDKLNKANESYEEKDKMHKEVEGDISALARRIMLMEEESKKAEVSLANTVTKLALSSKQADEVLKKVKVVESKCTNNEVTLEELDKNLRQTTKMASDNEQKLDELSRKLGVREEKLKDKILSIQNKFKSAEGRYEYGEMNITKLNQRIDDIEDEIYREKLKIKKVSDELGETFDDML